MNIKIVTIGQDQERLIFGDVENNQYFVLNEVLFVRTDSNKAVKVADRGTSLVVPDITFGENEAIDKIIPKFKWEY